MKKIGQLIRKNPVNMQKRPAVMDEKSLFFIFQSVIREEYGKQGAGQVTARLFKDKKLFVKAGSSNWANEIWLNREYLVKKMNREIGWDEVREIILSQ